MTAQKTFRIMQRCIIFFSLVTIASAVNIQTSTALSFNGLDFSQNGVYFFNPNSNPCGSSGTSGEGVDKLDGYSLPAAKGKVGTEEVINDNGQVPSTGGRVTFADLLNDIPGNEKQLYKDFYITMRWNYVAWNWNGTSTDPDQEQVRWMRKSPRKVLVTNPRTKKSIITVALEAGPAPWTGVNRSSTNTPPPGQGWVNPQRGTPEQYTGRVGGFPPAGMKALEVTQGMHDGSGDILHFSWAPDQNAKPGPVAVSGQSATTNCSNPNGGAVNAQGYAFPLGIPKAEISNGYKWPCPSICHHDGSPAFDLAHRETVTQRRGSDKDAKTAGAPVYAVFKGAIKQIDSNYRGNKGCVAFQLVADDGYKYWYGHLANLTAQNGQRVEAGQQIAQVGERRCTGNGSYPHLHIDRGFPKGHAGGSDCCRDPAFISLINTLYDELR